MKKVTNARYAHILKYTGLFGSVQGLNILIGLVRNKLVALILGPDGMGLISLFNSTVNMVSNATNLGIPTSAVRELSECVGRGNQAEIQRCVSTIRTWSLLTAVLGTLLCGLLGPLFNLFTFAWGDHTLHFVALAPVVGLIAVTSGEIAVLKGLHRMRRLAFISVINVILALVTSVPVLYYYGQSGIVPSLVVAALFQMLVTVAYSCRVMPYRVRLRWQVLSEGWGMVRLGVAFVLSAVLASCADFIIRSFLNQAASLDMLGLYNAGYMISVTYGGMLFAALEADYFPRLSAIASSLRLFRATASHQVEVLLLLACPMVVLLSSFMPIVIPTLFSTHFLPVVGMAQVAVLSLSFRAMYLPMAYMNLAWGNSLAFLVLETVSAVAQVLAVVAGYRVAGLMGTGYGIMIAHLVDLLATLGFVSRVYGFRFSRRTWVVLSLQVPVLLLSWYAVTTGLAYWLLCAVASLLSLAVSSHFLLKSRK